MKLIKQIEKDFTTIHNAFLKDESLSISARGLLVTMLSLKDDWNFSIKGLAAILKSDGERKISSALKELEEHKFLVRKRICDNSGKVKDWQYIISDEPLSEEYLNQSFKKKAVENPVDKNVDISVENDDEEVPENHDSTVVEDDVETIVNKTVENTEETVPVCPKPQLQNADVVNADVDIPDVDNPHLKNRHNYKYTNNQISKNKKTNILNINQSNHVDSDRNDVSAEAYKFVVSNNIGYDALVDAYNDPDSSMPGNTERLNEIVDIMVDCICSGKQTIRVRGEEISQEKVRYVMLQLTQEHIIYVMECLEANTSNVRNIRAYLITALYNAPSTINSYYSAKVNHDMNGNSDKSGNNSGSYSDLKPLF